MSSSLRNQTLFEPINAHIAASAYPHTIPSPPAKKQKMSLTQTYRLAHRARGKLSYEASRGDHDLRLLVGHANLLDSLMLELQEAEREQEQWFERTVSVASSTSDNKKVQFADQIIEQHELDIPDASDEEDSDDDIYEDVTEDAKAVTIPISTSLRRSRPVSPPPHLQTIYDEDEEMGEDDESDNEDLMLVRTQSHTAHDDTQCPDLVHESDSDSDDEMSPVSPPAEVLVRDFASQPRKEKTETMEMDGFFLPSRNNAPLVAAY